MKRKIGLMALALALTATLAACGNTAENPDPSAPAVAPTASAKPTASPEASPNTVTKGLDDVGNMARGAVNDAGRMVQDAGDAMRNW